MTARSAIIQPRVPVNPARGLLIQPRIPRLILPSDYPTGLVGWFAPSSAPEGDGVLVPAITNNVNGSRLIAQATASARPTMRRGAAGIGNRDAIEFITDDWFDAVNETAAWGKSVPGFTMLAVVRLTALTGLPRLFALDTATANQARFTVQPVDPNGLWSVSVRRSTGDAATPSTSTVVADTLAHVVHITADFANSQVWWGIDGQALPVILGTWVGGVTDATNSLRSRIAAADSASPSLFFNGLLGLHSYWANAYTVASLAPLVKSWCAHYGITYLGA